LGKEETMSDKLSLPVSSFRELVKIIKGYSSAGDEVTLDEMTKLVAMNRTRVSANNKFLAEIGLIQGGRRKSVTPLGKKLGRALDMKREDEAKEAWQEALRSNETMANLVTTVRIKGGMTAEDLASHILFVSGEKNTKGNRTGARTVVEILKESGSFEESDGLLHVAAPEAAPSGFPPALPKKPDESVQPEPEAPETTTKRAQVLSAAHPSITINIQLQLPETENAEVYEKLFKALRTHLLNPDE
jgi:hypothetical protein